MSEKIVQLNEEIIKSELKELVVSFLVQINAYHQYLGAETFRILTYHFPLFPL